MVGSHFMKSWSSTQKTVALSSGEAERTALVKFSCELLGVIHMAADWDLPLEGEVYVDSSAALGVVSRKGAGKLRHVRVGLFRVQDKSESGEACYRKVRGTDNPADAMTKPVAGPQMERYRAMVRQQAPASRASKGLQLARGR